MHCAVVLGGYRPVNCLRCRFSANHAAARFTGEFASELAHRSARYPGRRRPGWQCGHQCRWCRASNLYPKIQLSASVGPAITQSGPAIRPGEQCLEHHLGLTAPIFDGARLRPRKRRRSMPCARAPPTTSRPCSRRFAQVADLLEALDHDAEQLDAPSSAQQAAQSSLDLARLSLPRSQRGRPMVWMPSARTSRRASRYVQGGGAALPRYRCNSSWHWAGRVRGACRRHPSLPNAFSPWTSRASPIVSRKSFGIVSRTAASND